MIRAERFTWVGRACFLALAALMAAAIAPARSQESLSVKELLNRAQKKPQTEAVEDLIRKLKGGEPAPANASVPQPPPLDAAKTEPAAAEKTLPPVVAPAPAVVERAPGPARPVAPATVPEAAPAQASAPPQPELPAPPAVTAPVPLPVPAPAAAPKAEVAQPPPSVDLEIPFDYNSAKITAPALELLTTLGRALSDERLGGQTFVIAGHTDGRGGAIYNLKLSQARAEAVREFLIANFSVEPGKLVAEGHGERQLKNARRPLAKENRRVQVTNVTPKTARP